MQIEVQIDRDEANKQWQCYFLVENIGGGVIQSTLNDVEKELRKAMDYLVELEEISGEYMDAPINWSVMEEAKEDFDLYVASATQEQKEELRKRNLID